MERNPPLPNTPTKGERELPGKEDVKEPSHGTQPARPSTPSTTEKQPKETATHEPTPSGGYGISRFDKLFEKEHDASAGPGRYWPPIAYQESNFRPRGRLAGQALAD